MSGEEGTRNFLVKRAGCVISLFRAYQFGRLECEARVYVAPGRIDREADLSSQTFQPCANVRPFLGRKRFRCAFGRRLRMNLKWEPPQIGVELARCLFGPDRAEITKRSNNVGPDIDHAIHNCDHRNPIDACVRLPRIEGPSD